MKPVRTLLREALAALIIADEEDTHACRLTYLRSIVDIREYLNATADRLEPGHTDYSHIPRFLHGETPADSATESA